MFPRMSPRPAVALAFAFLLAAEPASAIEFDPVSRVKSLGDEIARAAEGLRIGQLYNRPPADLDEAAGGASPNAEAAALGVKVGRLERDLRQMTGRIEELQHQIQQLEEQLRAAKPATTAAATPAPISAPAAGLKRGDAFDAAANPGAAGAPRPLGTTPPSAPMASASPRATGTIPGRETGQPLDITLGKLTPEPVAPGPPAAPGPTAALGPTALGPAAPPSAKDDYDRALASLRAGEYETAEKGFSGVLAKNPKGKLAAGATFNLGESYFLRGRHREAAEKYLEISTKYAQSAQAPEAMLRLGQTLNALGAKEQACASFTEIGVKYPDAPSKIKDAADRESKKIKC